MKWRENQQQQKNQILILIELVADNLEIRGGLNSPSFKVSELIVGGK